MKEIERTVGLDTRMRLLLAARRMFAERGMAATSIRELVVEAGVNVAAVNYHFGDKENLYLETLRYCYRAGGYLHACGGEILRRAIAVGTEEAALQAIRDYIRDFLGALFFSDDAELEAKLLFRELTDPTAALDVIVQEFIAPKREMFCKLIAQARPELRDNPDLMLYAGSVIGQCLYYRTTRAVFLKLLDQKEMTPALLDRVASHIANFTLAALMHSEIESQPAGRQKQEFKR